MSKPLKINDSDQRWNPIRAETSTGSAGVADVSAADDATEQFRLDYEAVFEDNPLPMWIYDLETLRFLSVNKAATELYGYTAEEFLSKDILEMRPSEDVPLIKERIKIRDEKVLRLGAWRHHNKDGTLLYVDIIGQVIHYRGRSAMLYIIQDVSERVAREASMTKEHEQIAAFLEEMADGFYILDRQFRITHVNKSVVRTLGIPSSQLVGRTVGEVFPETLGTVLYEGYMQAASEQKSVRIEYYSTMLRTWYEVNIYPSSDGLAVYFKANTDEVAARQETALRQEVVDSVRSASSYEDMLHQYVSIMRNFSSWDVVELWMPFGEMAKLVARSAAPPLRAFFPDAVNEEPTVPSGPLAFADQGPGWMERAVALWPDERPEMGEWEGPAMVIPVTEASGSGQVLAKLILLNRFPLEKDQRLLVQLYNVAHFLGGEIVKHQAQERISRLVHNQTALINSTEEYIWSIDREYRLLSSNEAYMDKVERALGRRIPYGDPVFQVQFEGEFNERWKANYDRALAGETFKVIEAGPHPHTSRMEYQEICFNPIVGDDGVIWGVGCYARDLTERMEHIKLIESQNARLREIAWTQSHEVRGPLTKIQSIVELLKEAEADEAVQLRILLQKATDELDAVVHKIVAKAHEAGI